MTQSQEAGAVVDQARRLPLSKDKEALVDPDVYAWASTRHWYAVEHRGKWYAATRFKKPNGRWTSRYLHRLVAGAVERRIEIDHVNGDSLDCRRENLRAVTHRQNLENRAYGYGEVPIRGVSRTESGKYVAQAKIDGKHLTFGRYDTPEEAEEAALQGRLKHMTHSDPEVRARLQQEEDAA